MAYKTILLHLNNEHRASRLIDAALKLAEPAAAHLIGLFVLPHLPYTSRLFPKISTAIARNNIEAYRHTGEGIHQTFECAATGLANGAEWRIYEARRPSYVEAVLDHARSADLVIAAQKESDWDYADVFDVPDWLALDSGRPVLIIPKEGPLKSVGERVLVAWNNSSESARAVFDAMPLLMTAKEVHVLCIEETDKPKEPNKSPEAELCATLARQGIKGVAVHLKTAKHVEPGELLLSHVKDNECDLLVMGCYGRSRLREFILGGASRHVLHHATVPVLMAR
jgi:nucleotide-binding universal stress UspA family protein